jgi:delta-aminolevulinic acid dehydratase/porphobilinogen synthase
MQLAFKLPIKCSAGTNKNLPNTYGETKTRAMSYSCKFYSQLFFSPQTDITDSELKDLLKLLQQNIFIAQ